MKFGKQIQAQQVPGWSAYYLDYKALKKIISSLLSEKRSPSAASTLTLNSTSRPLDEQTIGVPVPNARPSESQPPSLELQDEAVPQPAFPSSVPLLDGSNALQGRFFFRVDRELEKVNSFYLQKEAQLKLRLETLLSKRRAAAMRVIPDGVEDHTEDHVEWTAVEEGFRLLERDLVKLQQFVEINATGFRKILKKWDKRSKMTTKEVYLACQVDMQPVFNNRPFISELSDTVTACLLNITDLSTGLNFEGPEAHDIFSQIASEGVAYGGPFRDLENNFRHAVANADDSSVRELAQYADNLAQDQAGRNNVERILWKVIIDAPPDLADLVLASLSTPFDFLFTDDINGRTCLHEAAIAGTLRMAEMCLRNGVKPEIVDVYGRSALHYACMEGHADICRRLLAENVPADAVDKDNYSPLVYATRRGAEGCVRYLLEKASVLRQLRSQPAVDVHPLALACQAGHVDVVVMLLEHGAESVPNSNGEYPVHLAARAGHPEVCKLLLSHAGWDARDRYHEWTPMFHAARYGHAPCLEVLIDNGGRIDVKDEFGQLAIHYSAWYGHLECVKLLRSAATTLPLRGAAAPSAHATPDDTGNDADMDVDLIPSLSLPPPIMPHRVYGHNYLDKTNLVQVTFGKLLPAGSGTERGRSPALSLHHRLINAVSRGQDFLASAPIKLVMTCPGVNSAPYTIPLPHSSEGGVCTFQIPSLDKLSLEFTIYPNFGTKKIGRAVAPPALFSEADHNVSLVLPVLDNHLHVIGEVSAEVAVIKPFNGVRLEVGGTLETYWKSMAVATSSFGGSASARLPQLGGSIASSQTSPSNQSIVTSGTHAVMLSSLSGSYAHLIVQVTRDLRPVVYGDWLLPESHFDLAVSDVTLAQFQALAKRLGRETLPCATTTQEWQKAMARTMVPLSEVLKTAPASIGLALELVYPTPLMKEGLHGISLNEFVDSVLSATFAKYSNPPSKRHRLNFVSFSPDVCAALNWKQPNYPVFFASQCGRSNGNLPSPSAPRVDSSKDRRLSCLGAAVEFARSNNLLGVYTDAWLLDEVPSLIPGVKDTGLLIGVYGSATQCSALAVRDIGPDAYLRDDIVFYKDYSREALL